MHLTLVVDDVPFDVWLQRVEDRIEVEVDGQTYALAGRLDDGRVILEDDHGTHTVELPAAGTARIDGTHTRVDVRRFEPGGAPGQHTVAGARGGVAKAPMPGKVVRVDKVEGDAVEADEVVLVIEAMKMQIDVQSPSGGTIAEMNVEEGDAVDAVEVLFTVAAEEE